LTITINHARKIEDDANEWDDFLPGNHHLKSRHLLALEKATLPDIEYHYVTIFHKSKMIGLAYLQLFRCRPHHLNIESRANFKSSLINFLLPDPIYLLVCGNLFRINFQGFYFKNEQHNALIFQAIEIFIKQSSIARPGGIIIKDCKEVFLSEKYAPLKYHFFNGDVTMEISRRPHWNNFDDYLKDLTKKYAKRAKKILGAFEGVTTREMSAPEILENATLIERLYQNVINKQKIRLGIINANYLYELKKDLGHRFELHAIYINNKMAGFYTYIFYESDMETHYIGLDYTYNDSHKLYFNILFLSVQQKIARKYEKLELGRTAKEAKANLGAVPKQIFNYIKVKNPLARIALQYILKRFSLSENQKQLERFPLK
jgi:hypothetical protein